MRPYFANAATEGSAYRHPDRPSKFDCLDILTDELAILGWHAFSATPGAGSPPDSVRKKIAGTRLPCVPSVGGTAGSAAGASFRFAATHEVYHIRYKPTDSQEPRFAPMVLFAEPVQTLNGAPFPRAAVTVECSCEVADKRSGNRTTRDPGAYQSEAPI